MSFRWRSGGIAWVLLIAVGALAWHLQTRLRNAEVEHAEQLRVLADQHTARTRGMEEDFAGRSRQLEEDFGERSRQLEDDFAERSRQLEEEVRKALAQKDAMAEAVAAAAAEAERERDAQEERRREALEPMPEGVRLALIGIRECLRQEGHQGLRVIRARSLEDKALHDVELWDYDPEQLVSTLYRVGRMQIVLDRGESRLAMRFFDGYLSRHGQREDFPPDGFELLLFGVNGPMWEGRLPYLVEPLGSYPDEDAGAAPRRRLDPYTRRQWQNRLDLLLDESETRERMRIGGLAGIDDEGVFREVLLLAYDDKSLLQMAAEAEHMVVRVDETAGLVQLVLRDGVLRRSVGPTPISAAGYRILLPGVSPERARDIMMGMVAER